MPNPTLQDLVDRGRAIFRETEPTATLNQKSEWPAWIVEGLEQAHSALRYRLGGKVPPLDHPYWSQFFKEHTIALASDTVDYNLPSTVGAEFDFIHSLIEANSGKRLAPYNLEDELAIKRGTTLGVGSGYGRYTFVPGDKIRVLVSPGSFGIPKEARNLTLRYFRRMKHNVNMSDIVDVRHEFTVGPVNWGVYRALTSVRVDGNDFQAAYRAATNSVPKP